MYRIKCIHNKILFVLINILFLRKIIKKNYYEKNCFVIKYSIDK